MNQIEQDMIDYSKKYDVNFIPKNDAMIVWYPKGEIAVYSHGKTEREIYTKELDGWYDIDRKLDKYKKFPLSTGSCYFDRWDNLTSDEVIAECIDIIISDEIKDMENCYLELGKIDCMECMRINLYRRFFTKKHLLSYEEYIHREYNNILQQLI